MDNLLTVRIRLQALLAQLSENFSVGFSFA